MSLLYVKNLNFSNKSKVIPSINSSSTSLVPSNTYTTVQVIEDYAKVLRKDVLLLYLEESDCIYSNHLGPHGDFLDQHLYILYSFPQALISEM